jgi:hypothetical protein
VLASLTALQLAEGDSFRRKMVRLAGPTLSKKKPRSMSSHCCRWMTSYESPVLVYFTSVRQRTDAAAISE